MAWPHEKDPGYKQANASNKGSLLAGPECFDLKRYFVRVPPCPLRPISLSTQFWAHRGPKRRLLQFWV